ncbi:MAG: sodium:solute symporter family transporter, partial [Planctomycetaceae bacterium]
GDYLSAASFLGICGMIAFYGYDGFLYSIGYLAGWIVALFVVAEPMKKLGRFTFADALDSRFNSSGIKLAAGISTLVVSVFYLIPQMVGAGALVTPLLGFDHWQGVVMVGAVVILIVVTAGMVSTTWVQFLKGAMLVVFSAVLTWMILQRGLRVSDGGADGHRFVSLRATHADFTDGDSVLGGVQDVEQLTAEDGWEKAKEKFVRLRNRVTGEVSIWLARRDGDSEQADWLLSEAQTLTKTADGKTLVNGKPKGKKKGEPELHPVGYLTELPGGVQETGPLSFLG